MRWSWRALTAAASIGAVGTLAAFSDTVSSKKAPPATAPVDEFAVKVRAILEARCRPCHFAGGKMYERLPFDRPETIRRLGSARLFTRLKDEKECRAVAEFLGERASK